MEGRNLKKRDKAEQGKRVNPLYSNEEAEGGIL